MSQLDNKKANTAKKTFFILLIFTVICSGVTVALIYNTITLRKESVKIDKPVVLTQKEETPVKQAIVEKVKLTDKYFTNGIVVEERKISDGNVIYQYEDVVQRKLDINYVQISGLKNTRNSR